MGSNIRPYQRVKVFETVFGYICGSVFCLISTRCWAILSHVLLINVDKLCQEKLWGQEWGRTNTSRIHCFCYVASEKVRYTYLRSVPSPKCGSVIPALNTLGFEFKMFKYRWWWSAEYLLYDENFENVMVGIVEFLCSRQIRWPQTRDIKLGRCLNCPYRTEANL